MVSNIFYFHPYLGRLEDSLRAIGKPRVALVVTRTTFCGRPLRRNLVASEETFQEGKCLQGSGLAIMYIRIPGLNYQRTKKKSANCGGKTLQHSRTSCTEKDIFHRSDACNLTRQWTCSTSSSTLSVCHPATVHRLWYFCVWLAVISWRQFWQWKLELWLSCYKFTTWKAESWDDH